MVKYELLSAINMSKLKKEQVCKVLGLNLKRLYYWQSLYATFGFDGLTDRPPKPQHTPNRLLPEEEKAIDEYAITHPEQHHREIQFNLEKQGIYLSCSTVYRRLKARKLIKEHKVLKPKKPYQKPQTTAPHQHWLVDLTYILIDKAFWYIIVVIDLFSRYVVGWELSPSATTKDVQRTIDFALAQFNLHEKEPKPTIHSDNGSQMRAKSFKKFLRDLGILNDYSRAHIPQDLAVLERLFRTTKQEEVYRNDYINHLQARDNLSCFFDYYCHKRPHQGIGNVTPYDKLTGQDIEIIKMRKSNIKLAQQRRKLENRLRKMVLQPQEAVAQVYTKDSLIFS